MVDAVAEWRVDGPALNTIELYEGHPLSVAYTLRADTRWRDLLVIGPDQNNVILNAAGGATANASAAAIAKSGTGVSYLYVIRGTKWAKIRLSDMTLISDGSETALSEAATDIITMRNANGTQFVCIGMEGDEYATITTVSDTATDTWSQHASEVVRVFGNMGGEASAPRLGGMSGSVVKQLVLSGSVSPVTGVWETRATLPDEVTPLSLALDGNFWIPGTNKGPYYLNNDFQTFHRIIPEIGSCSSNCKAMREWSYMGLIIGLSQGTRVQKNVVNGMSIGPEVYPQNDTSVQGPLSAIAGTERWLYMAFSHPLFSLASIVAARPRLPGDWHNYPMSYFPLGEVGGCEVMEFTDRAGGRTNPTLVFGNATNISYWTLGRIAREIDDTNYRFQDNATSRWEGTEKVYPLRFNKRVDYIEIETENCTSSRTVIVSLSINGETREQVGATITSNGLHRIVPSEEIVGRSIKPYIELLTDDNTESPMVIGQLRIGYTLEPLLDANGERYE